MHRNPAETAQVENATKIGISVEKCSGLIDRRISVAPMMDWTDRHCRFFLRQFSPHVLLYSEMITAAAITRGDHSRLLRYSPQEHPLAIQLGGSDPAQLALAARIAEDAGYREVNLNCGCPSDRVHAGAFGACLMLQPALVAECVHALCAAVRVPVTVKLRIGVVDRGSCSAASANAAMQRFDETDFEALLAFSRQVVDAGSSALIVHARKAVLGGLSPHENRTVPPLRYDLVERLRMQLRQHYPQLPVIVNGGYRDAAAIHSALQGFDGVMIGREAYHRPQLLGELQATVFCDSAPALSIVLERLCEYTERESLEGTRPHAIARHMLGLMNGRPGAREFRQLMSVGLQQGIPVRDAFARAIVIAANAA
jgi:tRNA-dihydrouridine synthase A